jgi:hypothetical protein
MVKKVVLLDKSMMATASVEPRNAGATVVAEPRQREAKDYGEPLNFRVPAEFGEKFRMVAIRKKMKLQQLLKKCFEVYLREEGDGA